MSHASYIAMETIHESIVLLIGSPVILGAILLELLLTNLQGKRVYSLRTLVENCYLTVLNMSVDLLMRSLSAVVLTWFAQFSIFHFSNALVYWVALLVAEDFLYYWLHRVDHSCRLFWAVHVTHHSAEEFNFSVGFRSSVFQPAYRFIFFIPLALAGFAVPDIFFIYSATQLYGILLHTELNIKFGVIGQILVTPIHHSIHHGSNKEYLDKNLGMVFIVWDKLFGTYAPLTVPVRYGLTKRLQNRDAINLVFHEWKDIVSDCRQDCGFADKLSYIFRRPGWRHRS